MTPIPLHRFRMTSEPPLLHLNWTLGGFPGNWTMNTMLLGPDGEPLRRLTVHPAQVERLRERIKNRLPDTLAHIFAIQQRQLHRDNQIHDHFCEASKDLVRRLRALDGVDAMLQEAIQQGRVPPSKKGD